MFTVNRMMVIAQQRAGELRGRLHEDYGEGVVSAAIVILIIALIGVALWLAADRWFGELEGEVDRQIDQIGD